MFRKLILFLIVLMAGVAGGILLYPRLFAPGTARSAGTTQGERKILYYVDPMHPAYKSDKPGIAPDCGMKLEPVYADGGAGGSAAPAAPAAQGERKILYYVDPMHPAYKSDKPGIAPDCGMKLEPVYADGGGPGTSAAGQTGETMPPGTVLITPEKQQLIGVRFGEVKRVPLSRTIRAVGKIAYDETRVAHVHTKFEGWIDQVNADFVGKYVQKGQPLLTVYSPDLVNAEEELLLAAKAQKSLAASPFREVSMGGRSVYGAALRKLELWDITKSQIAEIEKRNEPIKNMTVFAPLSGYVLTRNAFPNQKIVPDTDLYSIADLSTVWAVADVYEYESADVKIGQPVRMTLSYYPGESFRGKITWIAPQVDPATRTIKVRAEFQNADMRLKPDMFANLELVNNQGMQLAVPEEAVMDSGQATTVFVDRGNGYLEPRKVELGEKVAHSYVVQSGLKEGERVVTSGNFLVDSESRLKSAEQGMNPGGAKAEPMPSNMPGMAMPPEKKPDHGGHKQ